MSLLRESRAVRQEAAVEVENLATPRPGWLVRAREECLEVGEERLVVRACVPVELELRARPVLEGRVLFGGEPLAGARVTVEAANRLRASVASLAGAEDLYRHVPIVDLPAAHQETWTDSRGRFRLGDWSSVSGPSFLTVRNPDGTIEVTRELVESKDCTIDLASFENVRASPAAGG